MKYHFDLIYNKMKPAEFLDSITSLFEFRTIKDTAGNEYVFYRFFDTSFLEESDILPNPEERTIKGMDRTALEAVDNHIHIVDNPKRKDFEKLCVAGEKLGKMMLAKLKYDFPDKKFCVFVTIEIDETMTIRFHQQWDGESYYFNPEDYKDKKVVKIMGFYC